MELEMKSIIETMPQVGNVEWIGVRPERRAEVSVLEEVQIGRTGLEGDHFNGPEDAPRTVTLIQKEHIDTVASILGMDSINPGLLRRNIVVSGINLAALKKIEFRIGDVVLRGMGNCPPCSRMEENLGPGGYNAMRGHGGITASVIVEGQIRMGDSVSLVSKSNSES